MKIEKKQETEQLMSELFIDVLAEEISEYLA